MASAELTPALRALISGLHEVQQLDLARWETVLRLARSTRLHGRLAAAQLDLAKLPAVVERHLCSAARIAAFNRQMLFAELHQLTPLCQADFPVILLKGAAYAAQNHAGANGRLVSDVDLLVPRSALRTMEQRLQRAGWRSAPLDPYDERYYRDWSHETPPLRFPGHFLEVDLHHAITPVTARLNFDPAPLIEASEALPGSVFRVLQGEDQLLHACLHCFQDGDLGLRLREVADIDSLLRHHGNSDDFDRHLIERAGQLGLLRPLWYGLHFAARWFATPQAAAILQELPASAAPSAPARLLMDRLVPLAMLPGNPDLPPPLAARVARQAMLTRYHWQRMPVRLLLPHLARKAVLRARWRRPEQA